MREETFVVWYDESKQPVTEKILAAVANYRRRFPTPAGAVRVLVHPSEVVTVEGVTVEAGARVTVNTFWVMEVTA
jgi:hypothetical protein